MGWCQLEIQFVFRSSKPSEFLLSPWKANCCRIWLFQSQLNLEKGFLTIEITCAAWRNKTCSQRAEMDQSQCGAVGATCEIAPRSCSITLLSAGWPLQNDNEQSCRGQQIHGKRNLQKSSKGRAGHGLSALSLLTACSGWMGWSKELMWHNSSFRVFFGALAAACVTWFDCSLVRPLTWRFGASYHRPEIAELLRDSADLSSVIFSCCNCFR